MSINRNRALVKAIKDPFNKMDKHFARIESSKTSSFILCLGSTMTSDIEGISAAGVDADSRRLTPRFDAEALILGKTADGSKIPVSPSGIASPVVLTRASLDLLNSQRFIVDCGTFASPRQVNTIKAGTMPAQCVSSGNALPIEHVHDLFDRGVRFGSELSKNSEIVIIGECVPGGTTTAMAVLNGLGYDIAPFVSSSVPGSIFEQKLKIVNEGLEMAGLSNSKRSDRDPFFVLSSLGDPMQPFAAGAAVGASKASTIILAGGSQMLAVFKIACEIATRMEESAIKILKENTTVITTKWVVYDERADTAKLAEIVNAPLACTTFDLSTSSHEGLRAYESGHVKEGVGAGGSLAAAHLISKADQKELLDAVESSYNQLVSG